jgi:hypothetical protein
MTHTPPDRESFELEGLTLILEGEEARHDINYWIEKLGEDMFRQLAQAALLKRSLNVYERTFVRVRGQLLKVTAGVFRSTDLESVEIRGPNGALMFEVQPVAKSGERPRFTLHRVLGVGSWAKPIGY